VNANGEIANEVKSQPAYNTIDEGGSNDRNVDLLIIENRLSELKALCGQIHKGWWSYEWCFEQAITQFHIEYDSVKNQVQVESVMNLGTFKSRSVFLDLDQLPPNEFAEDTPEVARVLDIHDGGGTCAETGNPRKTYVHLQCCSEKITQQRKGMLHREGRQIASEVAAVLDVNEDPDHVCTYNVTVCTPLLCGALDDSDPLESNDATTADTTAISETTTPEAGWKSAPSKENESIRDILDRTLSKLCLQTNPGGWWTYEICHKQGIRQFHAVTGMRRDNAGAKFTTTVVESEHILGKYDATTAETVPDKEEWMLVVNATSGGKTWGEGNGAYYEVEYTGGDICDHSDVTDAAIVAGSTSAGGGVERASTVRFFCGQAYDVAVNEDSTCHYVVQVKVPALCKHPLFRAPVVKKQVMKCLPVD
jgi:Glucosidase II beta subunit-like protein